MYKSEQQTGPLIVWLRQDLRLADNPALSRAIEDSEKSGQKILPVYILDDKAAAAWPIGSAQKWALHHALAGLQEKLPIYLRRGDSLKILQQVIAETGATAIYWNRRYEKWAVDQDIQIKEALKNDGLECHSFNGRLLLEPWEIQNGKKEPYRVFTPYWRMMQQILGKSPPLVYPGHKKHPVVINGPKGDKLEDWKLLPTKPNWANGFEQQWQISEAAAHKMLANFIDDSLAHYTNERDFPAIEATSRLSPYLALGLISPRQIWLEVMTAMEDGRISPGAHHQAEAFLRQIAWREFSYHLLFYFPHSADKALYPKYDAFPWRYSAKEFDLWKTGQTGYPLVDAGMRQLWQTGWMHNRVRLVVASFLVKHLLIKWQDGAAWFWDTLIDADLANNAMGWQWTAGSGADASPYFRIFNPITQSEKFDAKGDYIREFIPELAGLPDKYLHAPWTAPGDILAKAGVELGKTYPKPMVDHAPARARALEALKGMQDKHLTL